MMAAEDDFIGPVNLGNPTEYTIRQLAEIVLELVGSEAGLVSRPLPADDPVRRRPDITLARRQLQWEPSIELVEGLQKTIDWFRDLDTSLYQPPTPNY